MVKNKALSLLVIVCVFSIFIVGCEKKEEKASEVIVTENTNQSDTPTITIENEEPEITEETIETPLNQYAGFEGEYAFSSGVGAWSTSIKLDKDGNFTGFYHDTDMGDIGEKYAEGTIYVCEFEGEFGELTKVDDYTYRADIVEFNTLTPTGTQEIKSDIRYIYSDPYGFEEYDEFEFYLPGKKTLELDSEFLSWTSLRYKPIFPAELSMKSICNVKCEYGFECFEGKEKAGGDIPASLPLDGDYLLAGKYEGNNSTVMSISVYSFVEDEQVGNISWIEDETSPYQEDAKLTISSNGYQGSPEYQEPYAIIVTDNSNGNIVLDIYSNDGIYYATYTMVEHYES